MEQFVKSQLEFNRLLLSVSNLLQGTLYGKLAHLQTEFVGQLINPSCDDLLAAYFDYFVTYCCLNPNNGLVQQLEATNVPNLIDAPRLHFAQFYTHLNHIMRQLDDNHKDYHLISNATEKYDRILVRIKEFLKQQHKNQLVQELCEKISLSVDTVTHFGACQLKTEFKVSSKGKFHDRICYLFENIIMIFKEAESMWALERTIVVSPDIIKDVSIDTDDDSRSVLNLLYYEGTEKNIQFTTNYRFTVKQWFNFINHSLSMKQSTPLNSDQLKRLSKRMSLMSAGYVSPQEAEEDVAVPESPIDPSDSVTIARPPRYSVVNSRSYEARINRLSTMISAQNLNKPPADDNESKPFIPRRKASIKVDVAKIREELYDTDTNYSKSLAQRFPMDPILDSPLANSRPSSYFPSPVNSKSSDSENKSSLYSPIAEDASIAYKSSVPAKGDDFHSQLMSQNTKKISLRASSYRPPRGFSDTETYLNQKGSSMRPVKDCSDSESRKPYGSRQSSIVPKYLANVKETLEFQKLSDQENYLSFEDSENSDALGQKRQQQIARQSRAAPKSLIQPRKGSLGLAELPSETINVQVKPIHNVEDENPNRKSIFKLFRSKSIKADKNTSASHRRNSSADLQNISKVDGISRGKPVSRKILDANTSGSDYAH